MADLLVYELHGRLLRVLALQLCEHVQGLQQAARLAQSRRRIDNRLFKKLVVVDNAFSLQRHITELSAHGMVQELSQCLAVSGDHAGEGDDGGGSGSSEKAHHGGRGSREADGGGGTCELFDIFDTTREGSSQTLGSGWGNEEIWKLKVEWFEVKIEGLLTDLEEGFADAKGSEGKSEGMEKGFVDAKGSEGMDWEEEFVDTKGNKGMVVEEGFVDAKGR